MYSRVGIHVPNKNSKEDYSIRDYVRYIPNR